MARPTKYTPELIKKAHDYLKNYEELGDVIPSHVGLALSLGITTTCLYDWAKQEDKEEFSVILQDIMATQQRVLITNGLKGEFNSNITKLVLGKHGFHDKQETELTGANKGPLEFLASITPTIGPPAVRGELESKKTEKLIGSGES